MGKLIDSYHSLIETPMKLEKQVFVMTVIACVAFIMAYVAVVAVVRNAR
jgi:hypothetical protein